MTDDESWRTGMISVDSWQTPQHAYRFTEHTFVKRELRKSELMQSIYGHTIQLPITSRAQLRNEYLFLQFLQGTQIPVPRPISFAIEDDAAVLTTQLISNGIPLADYVQDDRKSVVQEVEAELLDSIIPKLHQYTSHRVAGLDDDEQITLLPPRLTDCYKVIRHRFYTSRTTLHLCHNDLGQSNIFIDPTTHKIVAIIDWEYAGSYPPSFEAKLWRHHPVQQEWDEHDPEAAIQLFDDLAAESSSPAGIHLVESRDEGKGIQASEVVLQQVNQ